MCSLSVFLENCLGVLSQEGEVSACHPPATVPFTRFGLNLNQPLLTRAKRQRRKKGVNTVIVDGGAIW